MGSRVCKFRYFSLTHLDFWHTQLTVRSTTLFSTHHTLHTTHHTTHCTKLHHYTHYTRHTRNYTAHSAEQTTDKRSQNLYPWLLLPPLIACVCVIAHPATSDAVWNSPQRIPAGDRSTLRAAGLCFCVKLGWVGLLRGLSWVVVLRYVVLSVLCVSHSQVSQSKT